MIFSLSVEDLASLLFVKIHQSKNPTTSDLGADRSD